MAQDDIINLSLKVNELYQAGRYTDALPLAERAVRLAKTQLRATDPAYSTTLNNLASVYRELGRLDQAEGMMK
jgi:tetratricopeptide (TPR) repeat protein